MKQKVWMVAGRSDEIGVNNEKRHAVRKNEGVEEQFGFIVKFFHGVSRSFVSLSVDTWNKIYARKNPCQRVFA